MALGFGMGFPRNEPFAGGPSLNLQFVGNTVLSPSITFTRALNTATYFDATGTLQTASANTPRFDYNPSTLAAQGLLIEESRTNSIRNNTMQGAVAGTPGTAPTNWSVQTSASGLTRTIVGTGTENGITYIDVKYAGTTTGAVSSAILASAEQSTQIAAANGQNWTGSWYLSLSAGSLTGISLLNIQITERDATGLLLASSTANVLPTITSANLTTQRFVVSRTFNNASTAFVTCEIRFSVPISTAVDFTLRIGLPQLELGAFATSVIQTTGTAATRNADVATMTGANFSSWYNATEGTVFAEFSSYGLASAFPTIWQLDDGTVQNFLTGYTFTNIVGVSQKTLNVAQGDLNTVGAAINWNNVTKASYAYATNNSALSGNGSALTGLAIDSTVSIPVVTNFRLGGKSAGSQALNGYLRRITYYPRRLSNAELQAITS